MAEFFYDLCGAEPIIKDLPFNNAADTDGDTLTKKGAFVKVADWDNSVGRFICLASETTQSENQIGICMEEVAAAGDTYLMNSAVTTENWTRKKVLVNPHAVYLVEYSQASADLDTGFVVAAGATVSTTSPDAGDEDIEIGGWFYFTNGSNVDYLHMVVEVSAGTTDGIEVLRTAVVNAVAAADDVVFVQPPFAYAFDLNTAQTMLQSEWIVGSRAARFMGIDYWMKATGFPLQKLDPATHDGLKIANARFFHELQIGNGYFNRATIES